MYTRYDTLGGWMTCVFRSNNLINPPVDNGAVSLSHIK